MSTIKELELLFSAKSIPDWDWTDFSGTWLWRDISVGELFYNSNEDKFYFRRCHREFVIEKEIAISVLQHQRVINDLLQIGNQALFCQKERDV